MKNETKQIIDFVKKNYENYICIDDFISISIGGSYARGYAMKSSDIDLICLTNKYTTYAKKFITDNGFNIEIHIIPLSYVKSLLVNVKKFVDIDLYVTSKPKGASFGAKKCEIISKKDSELTSFLSNWREIKKISDSIVLYDNGIQIIDSFKEKINNSKIKDNFKELFDQIKHINDSVDIIITSLKAYSFYKNDVFSKVLWLDLYLDTVYDENLKEIIVNTMNKNIFSTNKFYEWMNDNYEEIIQIHAKVQCDFCKSDYLQCNIMRCINDYYNDAKRAKKYGFRYGECFSIKKTLDYIKFLFDYCGITINNFDDLFANYRIEKNIAINVYDWIKGEIWKK